MLGVAIVLFSGQVEFEVGLLRLGHQDKGRTNGRDPGVRPRCGQGRMEDIGSVFRADIGAADDGSGGQGSL